MSATETSEGRASDRGLGSRTSNERFLLPDVGEGLAEAEIVAWHVAAGDVVAVNDVVCDIETAKSVVELPSPFAGTVQAILAEVGQTIAVGTAIIEIGDQAATPATSADIDLSNPAASGGSEGESLVGRIKAERGPQRRRRRGERPAQSPEPVRDPGGRVRAKPLVRRIARDLGVDLAAVTATGPDGTVSRDDVLAAAGARAPGGLVAAQARRDDPRDVREPVVGLRKAMSTAMVTSAFTSPHVTEWITVEVGAILGLLDSLRRRPETASAGPLLLVAKACLLALQTHPLLNSYYDTAADEVVRRDYVNLGIAAATPRGLVVPNIKDAEAMSLAELAAALSDLVATAREGRTQPAQMSGGTFTLTNVGVFGVEAGTPIVNPGESAILAIGAINRRPWVVGSGETERLEIRDVATLALSFDHRHIDGETGSRFLADVAAILHDPGQAMRF